MSVGRGQVLLQLHPPILRQLPRYIYRERQISKQLLRFREGDFKPEAYVKFLSFYLLATPPILRSLPRYFKIKKCTLSFIFICDITMLSPCPPIFDWLPRDMYGEGRFQNRVNILSFIQALGVNILSFTFPSGLSSTYLPRRYMQGVFFTGTPP